MFSVNGESGIGERRRGQGGVSSWFWRLRRGGPLLRRIGDRKNPKIEIVNADASLLYRGFDIGTARPDKGARAKYKHHLIDILDPQEPFNAADYSKIARETIRDIIARSKTAIVVGGTGFYIDALFYGIIPMEESDEVLKAAKTRAEPQRTL